MSGAELSRADAATLHGPLFINGRFLTQRMTGVQRVAAEITGAIDAMADGAGWPPVTLLVPPQARDGGYRRLGTQVVGRRTGQAWEQSELPVHAKGGFLLNFGNTAPVLAGTAQAVVIHDAGVFDTPQSYTPAYRIWSRMLCRALAWRRARLITVSRFSRGRIGARLGIAPERIGLMREGADHILRVRADASILDRHGLMPGKFVLFVGSPAHHKSLGDLGELSRQLQRHGIIIACAGAINPAVFGAAAGAPIFPAAMLGRVSDAELRALYETALCLVFPSRYEGFGLPPVEAMACGCPVIARPGGAVEEICGTAALYSRHPDGADLPGLLQRLLHEPGLVQRLAAAGREQVRELTWANAARDLAELVAPFTRPRG